MGFLIARIIVLALLLFTGVAGLLNGMNEIGDAETRLQRATTVGVFLYGVLGIASAAGVTVRRRWAVPVTAAWGVVITFVATAAPLAYGGPDVTVLAALAGGFVTVLIALAVLWVVRRVVRPTPPAAE